MTGSAANRRVRDAFEQLEREIAAGRPPHEDYDLRVDVNGRWYYRGSPIEREAIVRLFASVLHRARDGSYWLVTPVERTRVHVDDAPFVATTLEVEGGGDETGFALRTNVGARVPLDAAHPLRVARREDGSPVPYLACGGGLEARIARNVYYELADFAEPGPEGAGLGIWSHGCWFALEPSGDERTP